MIKKYWRLFYMGIGKYMPGFLKGKPSEPKQLSVETDDWRTEEQNRIEIAENRRKEREAAMTRDLHSYVSGTGGFQGREQNIEQLPKNVSDESRKNALLDAIRNYDKKPKN